MNVTRILYFSLLSVPRISAVRVVLSPDQQHDVSPEEEALSSDDEHDENIKWFEAATDAQADWTLAYDTTIARDPTMPKILDTYFWTCVDYLGERVDIHLNYLNSERKDAEDVPSVAHPFDELSKLVYLIRYSNIRILYNAKWALGPGAHHPVLAIIDDEHVARVSTMYHDMKGKKIPYESYMIDAAVLYSMNKAMLYIYPESGLRLRLEDYRNMTKALHRHLARFMKITTHHQYLENVNKYENRVKQLYDSGIHGYGGRKIQRMVKKLAHQILYVIVIYGCRPGYRRAPAVGSRMLSRLLENHQAVRRLLNMDTRVYSKDELYYQELITSLARSLQNISNQFEDNHPWFHRLLPMVGQILHIGRRNN
jgi:hypothetical protein